MTEQREEDTCHQVGLSIKRTQEERCWIKPSSPASCISQWPARCYQGATQAEQPTPTIPPHSPTSGIQKHTYSLWSWKWHLATMPTSYVSLFLINKVLASNKSHLNNSVLLNSKSNLAGSDHNGCYLIQHPVLSNEYSKLPNNTELYNGSMLGQYWLFRLAAFLQGLRLRSFFITVY